MNTQTEAAKLWQELAEMTKSCSCWHVFDRNEGRSGTLRSMPNQDCKVCNGTGKVLLLPELSTITEIVFDAKFNHSMCRNNKETCVFTSARIYSWPQDCKGRGMVAVSMHLETLLDAMEKAGYEPRRESFGCYFVKCLPRRITFQHFEVIEGGELLAAVKAALEAIEKEAK